MPGDDLGPVGPQIRKLREARGLSRSRLAAKAEVTYAFIQQLETGTRKQPRGEHLAKIASALGVSVEELLRGEGSRGSEEFRRQRETELLEWVASLSADELWRVLDRVVARAVADGVIQREEFRGAFERFPLRT